MAGYRVKVEAFDGLTLTVAPLENGAPEEDLEVAEAAENEPEGS